MPRPQVIVAGLLVAALLSLPQRAPAECELGESSIGQTGIWNSNLRELGSEPIVLRHDFAQSWRVRIELRGADSCAGRVLIRDSSWRLLKAVELTESSAWSRQIPGATIVLNVEGCFTESGVKVVSLSRIAYSSDADLRSYSISGSKPNWVSLHDEAGKESPVPRRVRRLGDYVGVLWGFHQDSLLSWTCSGTMVGERYFLTNWHCGGPASMPSRQFWESTDSIFVDTSWDGDGLSREFAVTRKLGGNPELDYAVLELRPIFGVAPKALFLSADASVTDRLRVIHHPAGETKKYSGRLAGRPGDCRAKPGPQGSANDPRFLYHDCDTEGGSSGAPVFNLKNQIVALHHCGDDDLTDGLHNRAVTIQAILDDLSSRPFRSTLVGPQP